MSYVYAAITECRTQLAGKVPLIGFSGAPFTLLTYMIEGQGSKTFASSRAAFYKDNANFKTVLFLLSDIIIEYCSRQIQGGAQLIQIFESHALFICPEMVPIMSESVTRICTALKSKHPDVPMEKGQF